MSGGGADYNFLCGILRSREGQLAGRQRIESLASARSFSEAVSQLPEGVFGTAVKARANVEGIEEGYRAELVDLKDLLSRFSPSPQFSRLAFLPWDFHNLKSAVLQKLKSRTSEELYGPEGEVTVSGLKTMAEEMEWRGLPRHLFDGLQKAWIAYYEEDKDSQCLEMALDRQKQLCQLETATSVSAGVHAHLEALADLSVADILLRSHFAGLPWSRIAWGILGHADLARLKMLYPQKLPDWGGKIPSLASRMLQRVLLAVSALSDLPRVIAEERRKLLAAMQDWRYRPPSPEYAHYFVTRKLSDLYNIRLILLCALNGIPAEEARKRLNDAFV